MSGRCNICGGEEFGDTRRVVGVRCLSCGSAERHRLVMLHLTRLGLPKPGMRVAHFAPEKSLANYLLSVVGEGYEPYDLRGSKYGVAETKPFDLCRDIFELPSDHYDLIIHNHVLEHVTCNWTMVLLHLHRALKPGGWHLFSIPFNSRNYEENLDQRLSDEQRVERFNKANHVRNFGREDVLQTLGMLFDFRVEDILYAFDSETLRRNQILKDPDRLDGHNVFCFTKSDCAILQTQEAEHDALKQARRY